MSGLTIFTLIHVVISLLAIGSGFVVLFGLIAGKRLDGWTAFFLATTIATSVETIARLPGGLSEQIAIKGRSSW